MVATERKSIDYGSFKYWRTGTSRKATEDDPQGSIQKRGRRRRPLHHTIPIDVDPSTRLKLYIDAILSAKRSSLQQEETDEAGLEDYDRRVAKLNETLGPILEDKNIFTRENPEDERRRMKCAKLEKLCKYYQDEIDEWHRVLAETEPSEDMASSIAALVLKANENIDVSDVGVDAVVDDVVESLKEADQLSTQAMNFFVAQTFELVECHKEIECMSNDAQARTEEMSVVINTQFNPRSTNDYFTPPPHMRR